MAAFGGADADVCGLPVPSKEAYCAAKKEHPHAQVKHLCALARSEIQSAPQSVRCPRTGGPVCTCGAPYACDEAPPPK